LDGDQLPVDLEPMALAVSGEHLRPEAVESIEYLQGQSVAPKVLSGDGPLTVGAVARRVGIPDADGPVDARNLPDDPAALAAQMEEHSVFGRVAPDQKQAMVAAL
jgi:cation-transporting ATPase E